MAPDRLAGPTAGSVATPPEEQAERLERLQIGAEALGRLKPQEIRCLLLLAEGHSYAEICAITGFSYTKVNRCLSEGRRAFLRRVEGIESGAECERLAPLLSALADGEATAKDMAALRPHLRTCLSCRAALRDAREVPARVAALAPIGLLAGGHASGSGAGWLGAIRSAGDWLNERLTSLLLRGQEMVETASSHKLAAAAASAAALGGGGIATVEVGTDHGGAHQRGSPHGVVAKAPPKPVATVRTWRPVAAVTAPKRAARPRPHRHAHARRSTARPAATMPEPAPPSFTAPQPAQRAAAPSPAPTTPNGGTGEFGP